MGRLKLFVETGSPMAFLGHNESLNYYPHFDMEQVYIKNTFVHVAERVPARARSASCPAVGAASSKLEEAHGSFGPGVHTVMLKNLPSRCTANEVLSCVDDLGFKNKYDVSYMPKRPGVQNLGYMFIRFLDPADAYRIWLKMNGFQFPTRRHSTKRVELVPAADQTYIGKRKRMVQRDTSA